MILSQVIVDLVPGKPPREDIEVWNDSEERIYVQAEPFEIRAPGTPEEQRVPAVDPELSGILVSPQRLVLEPGERRLVRIAAVGGPSPTDRIYRVAIRPVAGPIAAERSALKVLVGYDTLVLVRPARTESNLEVTRTGRKLLLHNAGNTAEELFEGRQCDSDGKECRALPAKRLYAGATWEQELPFEGPASYTSAIGPKITQRVF
jgi:P pilus assembly chaperone PapD